MRRQLPNILVTGTPGVGKTTLCKLLAGYIQGQQYLGVSDAVNSQKLYKSWNQEFDVPEFDEDMVCDYMEPFMQKGGILVEFHTCGFFPERWFDLVILLRVDNTPLYDRLKARGYKEKKITENIEAEILFVTRDEVFESYKKEIILELQSNSKEDV